MLDSLRMGIIYFCEGAEEQRIKRRTRIGLYQGGQAIGRRIFFHVQLPDMAHEKSYGKKKAVQAPSVLDTSISNPPGGFGVSQ
ncbi:Uncharacterised protein [uncultured archaeon]|nr:Uncharacterised protein [uncultured archaeon]